MEDRTVNSLSASERSDDKATQLRDAASSGLAVPETVITNEFEVVEQFVRRRQRTVMKPLVMTYGCFGEARVVDHSTVCSYQAEIELAPAIYQEVIEPADDLRVTVIGAEMFTARIQKNNEQAKKHIDWRLDPASQCVADSLPVEVARKTATMMRKQGLKFGAIDFRRTPDGRHVFLENNTAGQYLWVEVDTRMPMSLSLARLLAGRTVPATTTQGHPLV